MQDKIDKLKDIEKFEFEDLIQIMKVLRSPDGCPWDREQTHASIRQYLIEEVYEVLETIDKNDDEKLKDELGDLLLQIVFHARIAEERGSFGIGDVVANVCRKMISRHIHVFGDAQAQDSDQALGNWESVKKEEKGHINHTQSLKDIPPMLPALMRSYKVQKKAANVGFDWDRVEDVFAKVDEEFKELKEAYKYETFEDMQGEMGDLLFAVVNAARFLKIEPEFALTKTTERFISRFSYIESNAEKPLEEMTLEEMDKLWDRAKDIERKNIK